MASTMADAMIKSPVLPVEDTGAMSDPNSAKQRRKRRSKEEIEAERQFKQRFKRKRGRPTRDEMELRRRMLLEAGLPVPESKSQAGNGEEGSETPGADLEASHGASPDAGAKKRGRKQKEVPGPTPGMLLGKSVHGVFDGSFDAGYFVTVKVADTDMVFRGVVFGPARAVPVTKANDIVPGVKTLTRQDIPLPPTVTHQIPPTTEVATTIAVPSMGDPTTATIFGPSL